MEPMRRLATLIQVGALTALQATLPSAAHADPPRDGDATHTQQLDDARFQFAEGSAHYQGRKYAEALTAFERSNQIIASPNADLMIARSLRELGRKADAATAFDRAEKNARRRVAAGEGKYAQTAEAARTEGDKVKSGLGSIAIHIAKPGGATVTVDGKDVTLENGDATLFHEPGGAVVIVRDANGSKQRQAISVIAGSSARLDFAGESTSAPSPPPPVVGPPPPAGDTPPKPSEPKGTKWTVPAAIVSGGVALGGLGVFTGFGLSSKSTFDDLSRRCGPGSCGDADRADAESGQRAQTIANVGLVIGAVATVAAIIFLIESAD